MLVKFKTNASISSVVFVVVGSIAMFSLSDQFPALFSIPGGLHVRDDMFEFKFPAASAVTKK